LHPFARLAGRHRTFLELHLAKTRRSAKLFGSVPPHIVTTGYLTPDPIAGYLAGRPPGPGPVVLSKGSAVGRRLVPMARDLRLAWEETAHQVLDERKQKVREGQHAALVEWARKVDEVAETARRLPTYVTLKDVKRRWGTARRTCFRCASSNSSGGI
jgi:hypothetical protein